LEFFSSGKLLISKEGGIRMKRKISVILTFIFTFIIHGVAFGGFVAEPPPKPPELPGGATGAYVKGYFTVAYDKANLPQHTHHNVHAVLEWDRTGAKEGMVRGIEKGKVGSIDLKKLTKRAIPVKGVHLFSAIISEPKSQNLCSYPEEYLIAKYWDLPDQLRIPAAFGVPQAKCHVKQVKIINKDFCGDLNKKEPDAMIRGEIEILLYIIPK
jgi:hypothetical protein